MAQEAGWTLVGIYDLTPRRERIRHSANAHERPNVGHCHFPPFPFSSTVKMFPFRGVSSAKDENKKAEDKRKS